MFKKKRATKFATLSIVFWSLVGLSLKLPAWRIAAAAVRAAALVVATLGDVLLTGCSGSGLRVNLLPADLVGELAAEGLARRPEGESQLRGYGATESALAVGSVQHLGRCHDGLMRLRVFRVLHAQLKVGIDRQEVLASLRWQASPYRDAERSPS